MKKEQKRSLGAGKSKRDTTRIGDISEVAIILRFLQLGYTVLAPYGSNLRYDLMVEDEDEEFWRIQCKTGWIDESNTLIKFDTANHNVTGSNRQMRHYRGQCDYFAVYCESLDKVYLIPVDQVGITRAHLRLAPPKNNQGKHVRWAKNYEF